VLGVPGWWAANASPDFYDDTNVFRPGRRNR
jgi:cytochrome P450